jgi:hypothetical protein
LSRNWIVPVGITPAPAGRIVAVRETLAPNVVGFGVPMTLGVAVPLLTVCVTATLVLAT